MTDRTLDPYNKLLLAACIEDPWRQLEIEEEMGEFLRLLRQNQQIALHLRQALKHTLAGQHPLADAVAWRGDDGSGDSKEREC